MRGPKTADSTRCPSCDELNWGFASELGMFGGWGCWVLVGLGQEIGVVCPKGASDYLPRVQGM